MSSKITSKGQITVPKVVREILAVQPGDRISFVIREDGTVTVEAESVALESLRGAIKSGGMRVTVEQMNDAIRRGGSRG